MDWNRKFSTIIKETESNLAKVKERLHSTEIPEVMDPYGLSIQKTYGTNEMYSSLTKPQRSMELYNPYKAHTPEKYVSTPGTGVYNTDNMELSVAEHTTSSGMITLLHDKIDAQSKTIESLLHTVKRLEEERDVYSRQVKELRDDIAQLNNRVMEKGIDFQTERKIDQWKQEVASQMATLQHQVRTVNSWSEKNGSFHDNQATQLIRDLHELKRMVSTECDGLRYSIDSVKNRLGRLEVDLNSTSIENRSIVQRQNFFDQNMRSFMEVQTTPPLSLRHPRSDLELSQLKDSIETIRDRLGSMESDLKRPSAHSMSAMKEQRKNGRKKKHIASSTTMLSPDTSDLDNSDSVDLRISNNRRTYPFSTKQNQFHSERKYVADDPGDVSIDGLNDSHDDLDDIKTADLDDVITANTVDLNLTDDDGLDDYDLENEPINDHELSIDELN